MQLSGNTILVTGGTSGIGMALAERFLSLGNEVIVCGRRAEALEAMKKRQPRIHTRICDVGSAEDRVALSHWITAEFPKLNVLVNNAGIQRKHDFKSLEDWSDTISEIDININGPVHLSALLIPHLLRQRKSEIINVSSNLAFVPLAPMPVYCASKAFIHSFTLSLRHQLKDTSVGVSEIIPPAVKTNLGGAHDFGADLDAFADSIIAQLKEGKIEATYGMSERSSQASRDELDKIFAEMNSGNWAP
jgi:uncharacterized oxidoreductase